jgi:hypothetical protein
MSPDANLSAPQNLPGPDRPAKSPATRRWLLIAELAALVMALLTLFGCVVVLFIFLVLSMARGGAVQPPERTGTKEDYSNFAMFETAEFARQRARAEQREVVYETCALLVGVAVAFFAVKLLLAAAQGRDEEPGRAPTTWERLAPMVPGLVALVCATAIVVAARESPPAAGPEPAKVLPPASGYG